MEKFKYSCPGCGQCIEYTLDHCGKQFACPQCHALVTFPEAPTSALELTDDQPNPGKKEFSGMAFFRKPMDFPHWKVVAACATPFFLVGGLLLGAAYMRKAAGDEKPAAPVAAVEPVSSEAWKKMTDLGQVEQVVQAQVRNIVALKMALLQAQRSHDLLHQTYHGATLEGAYADSVAHQYQEADRAITLRQEQLNTARQAFEAAYAAYQKKGGPVDYRNQLPSW
ncbi:MAG TPA: hypothetical protein VHB20_18810 [Verrucomicrobiae bacterium]|jgi:hypothetical protein|nr:hypothetical protein [Verrucomicrobiae bacterium]